MNLLEAIEVATPNIGLQRTSLRAAAESGSFGGPGWRLAAVGAAILSGVAFAAEKPPALGPADFRVGKVTDGMSTAAIRAALGSPRSVESEKDWRDPSTQDVTWHYDDLSITYIEEEAIHSIEITGKKWATARGLRVGDSVAKVTRLYGEPDDKYADDWDYVDHTDSSDLHVIRISIKERRVASIFLGYLYD